MNSGKTYTGKGKASQQTSTNDCTCWEGILQVTTCDGFPFVTKSKESGMGSTTVISILLQNWLDGENS
jgi:hypothetical protein